MDREPPKSTSTSKGSSQPTDVVETIPGNTGGGTSTHDMIINHGGNTDYTNTTGNSTGGNTDTGFNDTTHTPKDGFQQETTGDASKVKGSMMAVAVAIAGLVVV